MAADEAPSIGRRVEGMLEAAGAVPVVLASRVVLRDGLGRYRRTLWPRDLGEEVGAHAEEAGAAVRAAGVGGFWTHVGLPRAQGFALVPGSVVWLKPREGSRDAFGRALASLAAGAPIGERTAEGFGRVEVAPFPYGWTLPAAEMPPGSVPTDDDPRFGHFALTDEVRPRRPATRLRHDPARESLEGWAERVRTAGLDPAHDEWRTVARILYARAGDEAGTLIDALTRGGGVPRTRLAEAQAARDPKPFLSKGKGKDAWAAVQSLVSEAASETLREEERALRTRALADALAAGVNPGKGPG
jgi:hypothetical protein